MVTIKDIAREAGVSHATVSYVLNGKERQARIGAEACGRIRAAAERLGYQRNELARSMVTGRNDVLAFVSMNTGTWEYTGKIMSGIAGEVTRRGYALKVFVLEHSSQAELARQLIAQRVAGVLFHSSRHEDFAAIQEAMAKVGIPCATVNLSNPGWGFGVTSDDFQGMRDAVAHLRGLGHRRIAYLTKSPGAEYVHNRLNGYLAGMEGLEPLVGEDAARLLSVSPSAVACWSDYAAGDLLRVAGQLGLRIPGDLSAVGFADLDVAKHAVVPLTTVAQPFEAMGQAAAAALLDSAGSGRVEPANRLLPTTLVVRASTAPHSAA